MATPTYYKKESEDGKRITLIRKYDDTVLVRKSYDEKDRTVYSEEYIETEYPDASVSAYRMVGAVEITAEEYNELDEELRETAEMWRAKYRQSLTLGGDE